MTAHVLDNPIWASLDSRHAALAHRRGDVARYPADVAPFLGMRPGTDAGDALDALVPAGDTVLLLGAAPAVPDGWRLRHLAELAQMVCPAAMAEVEGPRIVELASPAHRADVLELTALVYPHYFRPRTMELGRYFGIYLDGRLAAMIGERMGTDDCQEISAVCTHPAFTGRGLARRLLAWLTNDTRERGRLPFLHVSPDNTRALQLYADNGYVVRRAIPFWSLSREATG